MLTNHLKMAVRSLIRQRGYTIINIVGLAVGLTVCLLVAAYIEHELSFENCHSKRDRIYRIQMDLKDPMGTFELAGAAPAMGPALREASPDIEAIARFTRMNGVKVATNAATCKDQIILAVEPEFFQVFDVAVLRGNPVADLAAPGAIYLTERLANSLYGRTDPLGQPVVVAGNLEYRVAGILKDIPSNTKLNCDALVSYGTGQAAAISANDWSSIWQDFLFVLARPGASAASLEAAMKSILSRHMSETDAAKYEYLARPLTSLYFNPRPCNEIKPIGNATNMLLFGAIALITLAIACINFVNHTTARTAHRTKELSMRKVVGASRTQLIQQLLVESLLASFISLLVALAAFEILRPLLDMFLGRHLDVGIQKDPLMIGTAVGLALLVGVSAGIYPALYLSRTRPLQFLKSGFGIGSRRQFTRSTLVVFQFTAAVILTTVAIVVARQIQFSHTWDKGFDDHDVIVLEFEGSQTATLFGPLKDALVREPGVLAVSGCNMLPGTQNAAINSFRPPGQPDAEPVMIRMIAVDPDFSATLGLKLVEGRNLTVEDISSNGRNIVLDQRAVAALRLGQPLGSRLVDNNGEYTVVGVLNDFQTVPTFAEGWPLLMYVDNEALGFVLIKVRPGYSAAVVDQIKAVWNRIVPAQAFEYSYFDDVLNRQYGDHEKFGALIGIFSGLAVAIACLGTFGLVSYAVERRRREIGIRKVVGATTSSIVRLLGSEFVVLILIANVIACPIAWYLSHRWLERFVYRVDIGPGVFLLAGGLALAVAVLSVIFQSLTTARANPVDSLKYE